MKFYVGTSGFSYKEWKGHFYPEKFSNKNMLEFYSQHLTSVEINNTFYRMPKPDVVENWAATVPEDFRFILKASRRITHFKRLKEAAEVTEFMLSLAAHLDKKLGAILFQLPPNFRKDMDRLSGFVDILPPGTQAAFEFRHESWFDGEANDLLARRDLSLCTADAQDQGFEPELSNSKWGYIRLRKASYNNKELAEWIRRIEDQNWQHCFVFFKHEDEGAGPKMAQSFMQLSSKK